MAWNGLVLTEDGKVALSKAQISHRMQFQSIVIGDGFVSKEDFSNRKELGNFLYEITDLKIEVEKEGCTILADLPEVEYDYFFREIGIMVVTEEGEKLYAYDNCGENAQFLTTRMGIGSVQKRIRLHFVISNEVQITVNKPSILYVTYDEFEADVKKLEEHLMNVKNPHQVTASQVSYLSKDGKKMSVQEALNKQQKIKIGAFDTELDCGDILFVTEDDSEFLAAAYSNFTLSREAPAVADVGNWGMVEGDLAVSEEAPTDAVFFADIRSQ